MAVSIDLVWIVVKDLHQAVNYYKDVVGLKLESVNEEFGWAELSGGKTGTKLGIAKMHKDSEVEPGQNAVVTISVTSIQESIKEMESKGLKTQGELIEIPHVVKMQFFKDLDGNLMQLVEQLS